MIIAARIMSGDPTAALALTLLLRHTTTVPIWEVSKVSARNQDGLPRSAESLVSFVRVCVQIKKACRCLRASEGHKESFGEDICRGVMPGSSAGTLESCDFATMRLSSPP